MLENKRLNRNELRERIRLLKNRWYQRQAEKAERYAEAKNHKGFYAAVNKVYGLRSKSSHLVRSKNGTLLTSPEEIKDRWVEHFTELLNQPSEVDESILEDIEQLPIDESLGAPITEAELDKSLNNTKTGKSAGPDGVLPEILVHGGNRLKAFLFTIISMFWMTENLPSDVSVPNISILFKKGDRSRCGNYRGISLLSVLMYTFCYFFHQELVYLFLIVMCITRIGLRRIIIDSFRLAEHWSDS